VQLRRRGIRVEVASIGPNLGSGLKSAANRVIDLAPLFATFEMMKVREDESSNVIRSGKKPKV
jgi:uncharacterized LabA/DUF88 family protein